ncbi:WbuC family cupin fold metalloprotein [Stutzerimonas azotifigens]|uniref:WbuC family cupin fold metalloprotein n=1 Tax=Stutzerimonas azotifigens TaxID=291995 RepID=UPI00041DD14E|nr:WbuC family cupin fold metalloprotein [Stutzerimonas azotifigens]
MSSPRYFDRSLFQALAAAADNCPRQRHHHLLHRPDEPCQRLLMGLQPSTYVAPHRHLDDDKAECLIVLGGRLGLLIFDEQGGVREQRLLEAGGDCLGVDIPPGLYHALVVLAPDSLLFECKAGPYLPLTDAERAPWAPREVDVERYLGWMKGFFD